VWVSLFFILLFLISLSNKWSSSGKRTSSLLEDHGENSVAMLKFPENLEFNEGSHTDSSVKESD
jgi:hypothetical protein